MANRFIAFEYCDEEGHIKNKYTTLELKKIHSSFEDTDKNELIEKARDAVCGGKYDIIKFNQAKKESICNGVDKFKASIDDQGYLVIQSVGENIEDANFKAGVKTNFRFEECKVKEITQDNLSNLFTNGSHGKNSGLSLLGAIEQSFSALREIEKGNDGKLINPKNNCKFRAIFKGYGETLRVEPGLDMTAASLAAATPPPGSPPPVLRRPAAAKAAEEAAVAAAKKAPAPAALSSDDVKYFSGEEEEAEEKLAKDEESGCMKKISCLLLPTTGKEALAPAAPSTSPGEPLVVDALQTTEQEVGL